MKRIFAFIVVALLFVQHSLGQPLADRLPSNAVIYVGWVGSEKAGQSLAGTHLQAILAESNAEAIFTTWFDALEARVIRAEPDAREVFRLIRTFGRPALRKPTAIVVGPIDQLVGPGAMIACMAGEDADAIAQEIRRLAAEAGTDNEIRAAAHGEIVLVRINRAPNALALTDDPTQSLASEPNFAAAMKQVGGANALITFHVNVDALVVDVEMLAKKFGDAEQVKLANDIVTALGLRGAHSATIATRFDGKDIISHGYVNAPGERTGLVKLLASRALTENALSMIPADSTFAFATHADFAEIVTSIEEGVTRVNPNSGEKFNSAFATIDQFLGVNARDELLEPLGDEWVMYSSPTVAGTPYLGMVAVNKLDDPAKFKTGIDIASHRLFDNLTQMIQNQDVSITFAMRKATFNGIDVTYLGTPIIAPAYAIDGGRLYVGFYPQSVASAILKTRAGGESFASNTAYKGLIDRLGVTNPSTFWMLDLPAVGGQGGYMSLTALTRLGGAGDLFEVPWPEPFMPTLPTIRAHLTPVGAALWSDETGIHYKSITPFPMASAMYDSTSMSSLMQMSQTATAVSVLLPALNRVRETANRAKSASNLAQIGKGIIIYANENRGQYPDDFGVLIQNGDLVPEVFTNPRLGDFPVPPELRANPQQLADAVRNLGHYLYIAKGQNSTLSAEYILAYENPDYVVDGVNVLYADGHVEFINMAYALAEIEKSRKYFAENPRN